MDVMKKAQDYDFALDVFLHLWYDKRNEYYKKNLKSLGSPPPFEIREGRKFDKIVEVNGSQSYVKCFVERSTGYIYKAASFKKPAKGPRASIFEPKSYEAMDAYTGWLYKSIGANDFVPKETDSGARS